MKIHSGETASITGVYVCTRCGHELHLNAGEQVPRCPQCGNEEFELLSN